MPANFSVQFIVNEKTQTRVLKLTDTSTGFTLAKGNFSITFPDGSTRIKTDFTSPDISAPGGFISIPAVTDNSNNVITGAYKIDFAALNASNTAYSASYSFDFNWVKPVNSITDLSDVLLPQVQFRDNASYSPIGSFTGTLTRIFSVPFPTTAESTSQPATTTSTNTLTPVYTGNYYEGVYNVSNDITCNYTHTSNSWLTINYVELFTKTVAIKKCPTQLELIAKINTYRGVIEAYKENNDTQFNLLSEQYDLAIALYSHIIARYETGTQDGSEGQLRELLSILEPYTGSYTYQSTRMLAFELTSSGANSFNITDGTNSDSVVLGSSLLFSSGNAALGVAITNNQVAYTPVFGATLNTFAQGNDSRFHNAVTIGTANGLSLASQVLSLALATSSTSGAMLAADKAKLDGIAAGANVGTVTSVGLSAPTAFTVTNSPVTGSGTIVLSTNGSPSQYITGAGALSTFLTDVRAGISLTTTGTSGAATYSSTTGILNIPEYQGGVTSFNTRTGAITLTSSDVTTALTFTPYNATNPSGYISGITSGNVTTALGYTPENAANKGIANGYAGLDGAGLVPSTQLPSYVDDVLEYADFASLPATGTTGKIYVTLDTNKIYRWSGTVYVEISSSAGGGGTWGSITGTLSNQTDLQAVLDAKQDDLNGTGFVKASGTTISYDNSTYYPQPTGDTTQYIAGDGSLVSFPIAGQSGTLVREVRNTTGATLTKGTVVYISGATGNKPTVSKALATGDSTSAQTFGLVQANISNNSNGYVVCTGDIVGLDTSSFAEGEQLYLSSTTAGTYTATKQLAPAHLVYIGVVTRSHPTQGQIEVKVQNGYELYELHDVSIVSKANNEGLFYESSTNLWKNKTIATVLGYTPYNAANPSNYIALTALSSTATGLTYTNTTGVFSLTSGYVIPTTTSATNWDTAYGWGNHASAGYLTTSSAASTYQPLDADLTAIAGLTGTSGFLKKTAANTWSLDTNTYLTSYTETDPIYVASSWYSTTNNASNWDTAYGWGNHASAGYLTTSTAASTYQPLDADLTAIAGLSGTSGFLKKTAANTYSLDTSTYLTSISSSDVTTALGYTPVTNARTITINGTTFDLSADRSYTVSAGTTLNGTGFVKASGTTITYDNSSYLPLTGGSLTGPISINAASLNHITLAGRFNLIGGSNFHIANNAYFDGGFKYSNGSDPVSKLLLSGGGTLSFDYAAAGTINSAVTFTTVMTVGSTGLTISNTSQGVNTGVISRDITAARGTNEGVIYLGSNGLHYLYFDGSNYQLPAGGLVLGGNFTETSSIKYKENISTLSGALDKIINLRGVSYNRKGEKSIEIGVIAEEMYKVVPELVTLENNEINSVAYSRIGALLIEAIKEQQKQIEELKVLLAK
jgi:hypothetical protein